MTSKMGAPIKVDMTDETVREQVKIFGRLAATMQEMADYFGVTLRTIQNYMADQDGDFFRIYKKAEAETKQSLRRMQIKAADAGNATMLVWLGKQLLGQKDVSKVENENREVDKDGNDVPRVQFVLPDPQRKD